MGVTGKALLPDAGLFFAMPVSFLILTFTSILQDVADSCRTGAATNVIFGLALGYQSCIIPCIVIAAAIYISFTLAGMFGIACAALGILTTLSTGGELGT